MVEIGEEITGDDEKGLKRSEMTGEKELKIIFGYFPMECPLTSISSNYF
jgi:hypothetical protein